MVHHASPSSSASCNKVRGVYSRHDAGRVWRGRGGAVSPDFSARIGPRGLDRAAAGSDGKPPIFGPVGVKVGLAKSALPSRTHAFPPFFRAVRLMGRWAVPGSAAAAAGGRAPLRPARFFRYPVASVRTCLAKTFRLSVTLNMSLPITGGAKQGWPFTGSGCGILNGKTRIRRVGVRLIFAAFARFSWSCGLSGPGLEALTLGGGAWHVNQA